MLYGQNLCNKQIINISYVYRFHCERVKICFVPLRYYICYLVFNVLKCFATEVLFATALMHNVLNFPPKYR